MYEKQENFDWHSLHREYNTTSGAFLMATRRAMVSNISQPPLIVAQHKK
jgi:hypothetical protein